LNDDGLKLSKKIEKNREIIYTFENPKG